jgi:hypothetical protein
MKIFNVFSLAMGLCLLGAPQVQSSGVRLSLVDKPDFLIYNRLFSKFNQTMCVAYNVNPVLVFPFEQLMFAYWYNSSTRLFFEIKDDNELVGFVLCQMLGEHCVYIRQFVMDPEIFDPAMLETLLGQFLGIMPQLTSIAVLCPMVFTHTIDQLRDLGFAQNLDIEAPLVGIYQRWDLAITPRCMLCQLIYGPEYWEQEMVQQVGSGYGDDETVKNTRE